MIIFDLHGRQIFDLLEDLLETTGWISMKSDVDFHDLRELMIGSSWPPNHSSCKKKINHLSLKKYQKLNQEIARPQLFPARASLWKPFFSRGAGQNLHVCECSGGFIQA